MWEICRAKRSDRVLLVFDAEGRPIRQEYQWELSWWTRRECDVVEIPEIEERKCAA